MLGDKIGAPAALAGIIRLKSSKWSNVQQARMPQKQQVACYAIRKQIKTQRKLQVAPYPKEHLRTKSPRVTWRWLLSF